MCHHDTWTTFNDEKDLVESQPYKASGDSYMFLYRRDDMAEVAFPPLGPQGNIEERVGRILDTFPSKLLQSFEIPYMYQTDFTDMSRQITREELHEFRVAMMGEVRDVKITLLGELQQLKETNEKIKITLLGELQQLKETNEKILQLLERQGRSYCCSCNHLI
jgi:hypothetical protein